MFGIMGERMERAKHDDKRIFGQQEDDTVDSGPD